MFPGPGASAPSAPSPGCSPSARPSWSRSLGPDPGPGLAASDREAAGPHQAVRRLRRWAGGPKGWRCCTFFLPRPVRDRWYFNDPSSQKVGSTRMNVQRRRRCTFIPFPNPQAPSRSAGFRGSPLLEGRKNVQRSSPGPRPGVTEPGPSVCPPRSPSPHTSGGPSRTCSAEARFNPSPHTPGESQMAPGDPRRRDPREPGSTPH